MAKQSIMFLASDAMADAVDAYVKANDISSRGELIRRIVAQHIGYDLNAEPRTKRRTKYANAEERAKANQARAKAKRDMEREVYQMMQRGEQQAAMEYMQEWLDARKREDEGEDAE